MIFFETIKNVNKILIGIYAYYGINGMFEELAKLKQYVFETILSVYKRRSQRNKFNSSNLVNILKIIPLAIPRIYHNIWV